jgi:uncharacterized protein (UPF0262 family)
MFVIRFGPMSPCLLLDLPEALARRVLQDWLHWKYVVRLDSAFCTHEKREQFTAVACGPQRTFTIDPDRNYGDFKPVIQWATSRHVQLDAFCMYKECSLDDEVLQAFLRKCGARVRWIRCNTYYTSISNCREVLLEATKFCPHVRELVVEVYDQNERGVWDDCLVKLTQALPELTDLSLHNAFLSKRGLAEALTECSVLERISISNSGQELPAEIAIPTLKSIKINSQHLSDDILIAIGQKCAKLEAFPLFRALYRYTNRVTEAGLRALLQGCPVLRDTDVERLEGFGEEIRVQLAKRRNFTLIDLTSWSEISDELLLKVLRVSPNLTTIKGRYSYMVTDTTLEVCGQHYPLLESLKLGDNHHVTNDGIQALVSRLAGRLRVAYLDECRRLCGPAVQAIAEYCPLLEEVVCPSHVSNAALLKLARNCPHLTHLKMSGSKVGDEVVSALAAHCPKLNVLYMGGCRSVTMQGVRALVEGCLMLLDLWLPAHIKKHPLPQPPQQDTPLMVFYAEKKGR